MADVNERDAKLVQYLGEAYGKERELETALNAHISMTTRPAYKKRLKEHLRETKRHAKEVERRIKKLGGGGQSTQTVRRQGDGRGEGPDAHGPWRQRAGEDVEERQDGVLQRARGDRHLPAIETLAEKVGDRDTAKLARRIRRDEERMARFLEGQIKVLTGAVVQDEIPASQRRSNGRAGSRSRSPAGTRSK